MIVKASSDRNRSRMTLTVTNESKSDGVFFCMHSKLVSSELLRGLVVVLLTNG